MSNSEWIYPIDYKCWLGLDRGITQPTYPEIITSKYLVILSEKLLEGFELFYIILSR